MLGLVAARGCPSARANTPRLPEPAADVQRLIGDPARIVLRKQIGAVEAADLREQRLLPLPIRLLFRLRTELEQSNGM